MHAEITTTAAEIHHNIQLQTISMMNIIFPRRTDRTLAKILRETVQPFETRNQPHFSCACVGGRQCDQIWPNFATLTKILIIADNFLRVSLVTVKSMNLLWRIFFCCWANFHCFKLTTIKKYSSLLVTLAGGQLAEGFLHMCKNNRRGKVNV